MSGREYPMERNQLISHSEIFWLVELEVVGYYNRWGQVSGYSNKQIRQWMVGTLLKPLLCK